MQQFMHVAGADSEIAYMPISGFTAVDLGYQKGDAVSNFVTCFDDPAHAEMYLQLFDHGIFVYPNTHGREFISSL